MHRFVFLALVLIVPFNNGSPVLPGHLNAHAQHEGNAMVDIEKDVVIHPGNGGHNFNAESESNGQAVVTIGGGVQGSAANRSAEEFNAVSKTNGTSQVRVNGDLMVENLDPKTKKFDAVSESGGQSLVQVGNVQITSSSRGAKTLTKNGHEHIGPAWGAAAVSEHNSRPWEELDSDTVVVPHTNSSVNAHESNLFDKPGDVGALEVHNNPHTNVSIISVPPVDEEHGHDHPAGNLNADSTGQGSKSIVAIKGTVLA